MANHFGDSNRGIARVSPRNLAQLQHDLAQLNISLIIEQKAPQEGIAAWVAKLGITHLYFQEEWTQEEQQVEAELRENLGNAITYQSHYDQFLYHPNDVPVAPEDIPEVFTVFRKKCEKMAKVRPCFAAPKKLDPTNLLDQKFSIPTLQDFGLAPLTQHPHSAFPPKAGIALEETAWNIIFGTPKNYRTTNKPATVSWHRLQRKTVYLAGQ